MIQGLENHPEFNGTLATILAWNEDKEVFAIKMDLNDQQVGLHPENLTTSTTV